MDYPTKSIHAPYPSFWKDAPKMSISTYFTSLFQKPKKPELLPPSYGLYPSNPIEHNIDLHHNNKTDYLEIRKLTSKDVHNINSFLSEHFYNGSHTSIKHSYSSIYLYESLQTNTIYGLKLLLKNQLVGLILARHIGRLGELPISLVTELCIHSSYRKRGYADILLRTLYSYSVHLHDSRIHFFHVDSVFNAPLIAPLNTKRVYSRTNSPILPLCILQPLTTKHLDIVKKSLEPHSLWIEPIDTSAEYIKVIQTETYLIILRNLNEINSLNQEEGAEILFTRGNYSDIDNALIHTPYGWFEASYPLGPSWKQVGNTLTYAFHLNYGVPSQRSLVYF
jgi:hypothetical protein